MNLQQLREALDGLGYSARQRFLIDLAKSQDVSGLAEVLSMGDVSDASSALLLGDQADLTGSCRRPLPGGECLVHLFIRGFARAGARGVPRCLWRTGGHLPEFSRAGCRLAGRGGCSARPAPRAHRPSDPRHGGQRVLDGSISGCLPASEGSRSGWLDRQSAGTAALAAAGRGQSRSDPGQGLPHFA